MRTGRLNAARLVYTVCTPRGAWAGAGGAARLNSQAAASVAAPTDRIPRRMTHPPWNTEYRVPSTEYLRHIPLAGTVVTRKSSDRLAVRPLGTSVAFSSSV